MVDAADLDKMEASRNELHSLLDKPQLAGIPVLVLGNKRDLPGALDETGLIERMYVEVFFGILFERTKHNVILRFFFLRLSPYLGICRVYRIEKYVVIAFRVRKRQTSTLLFNG